MYVSESCHAEVGYRVRAPVMVARQVEKQIRLPHLKLVRDMLPSRINKNWREVSGVCPTPVLFLHHSTSWRAFLTPKVVYLSILSFFSRSPFPSHYATILTLPLFPQTFSITLLSSMDLLKQLNLEDHLPEQQTRTSHLLIDDPELTFALGFNACCRCGKNETYWECPACHRVRYCSVECMNADATHDDDHNDDDEDGEALGHSPIICALLALCNDDEAVDNGKEHLIVDLDKRTAAVDRVISEFESYPATLANVIMDGPCYQDVLTKASSSSLGGGGGTLIIHIVGASVDSELWQGHPDPSQESRVFHGYAEALAEIADRFSLQTIHLYFIGPDCPPSDSHGKVKIPPMAGSRNDCILQTTTVCGAYTKGILASKKIPNPDIVVFFNPGWTVPDYSWEEALFTVPKGTPCLATTNTELEGVADIEFLYEAGIIQELPAALAMMLGKGGEALETTADTFFSVNPFCGSRVRQSGTMANDLYVKNRWIFGGIFGSSSSPVEASRTTTSGKRARIEGSGNSKQSNPALV